MRKNKEKTRNFVPRCSKKLLKKKKANVRLKNAEVAGIEFRAAQKLKNLAKNAKFRLPMQKFCVSKMRSCNSTCANHGFDKPFVDGCCCEVAGS